MDLSNFNKKYKLEYLIILIIFMVAIGIRLWGIKFGLPYLYHPDEPNKIQLAQQILKTGNLNPHYFLKPPFYIYLNALIYIPYLTFEQIKGTPISIQSLQAPNMLALGTGYTTQPSTVLIGRLLTLLFGSISVIAIYLVSKKTTNSIPAAGLAALFGAISPGLVPHSRYITPDSMVVFFCLLTAFTSINVYRKGRKLDYILAGISGALAASAKYDAVIVLIIPVAAHYLRNGFRSSFKDKKIFLSALASIITFLLLNPVAIFSFNEFYQGAMSEASHYATGHPGMEGDSLSWYISYFWTTEGIIAVLGVAGLIVNFVKRQKEGILLSIFPLVFFIFISSFMVRNDRTAIPITPFIYIFAANLLVSLFAHHSTRPKRDTVIRVLVAGATIFMLFFSSVMTIQSTQSLISVDSRETSREWIEKTIPAGTKIAIESYSPYIDPEKYQVVSFGEIIEKDPNWYQQNGIDYIVASEGMYGRFFLEPNKYENEVQLYNNIFSAFTLAMLFNDGNYEIRIYRIK